MSSITFVVVVGNHTVYESCFASSPLFQVKKSKSEFQVIPQSGFQSAVLAFNDAIEKAENDLIVFAHQDVILPVNWAKQFLARRAEIESLGVSVGVVGCWGITAEGERAGHVYHRDRQIYPKKPGDNGNLGYVSLPMRVNTLDELLISFRKSSGLRFDPELPSFFGYAVDVSLTAEARGLQNFAIDCPVVHQTVDQRRIRKELNQSSLFLVEKWNEQLPILTPSGPLTGKGALWRQRAKLNLLDRIGYIPTRMWWEELRQVDTEEVLYCDDPTTIGS